ncbi:MAG: hypothetical protein F6K19_03215 [Cyanothece sp. SIO1E1]|nr:hypothetical protein [Cyanothece sp. SIO1E1]
MENLSSEPIIKYKITPKEGGVILSIWEVATLTEARVRPCLFSMNYSLDSKQEALKILNHYLMISQVETLEHADLSYDEEMQFLSDSGGGSLPYMTQPYFGDFLHSSNIPEDRYDRGEFHTS